MGKREKVRTESFDYMQYFYRSVHEPIIHAMVHFSGHIGEDSLKEAVTLSKQAIPQIGCCFDGQERSPRWRERGFSGEDIVQLRAAEADRGKQEQSLLASSIDIAREPQLKIFLVRGAEDDSLCIVMNHMVCDGAGFKEYLYLLSGLYNRCAEGLPRKPLKSGPRGAGQLWKALRFSEKLSILFSKTGNPNAGAPGSLELQGDAGNPFFVTRPIGREELALIKAHAKSRNATVNDMVLGAYARVLAVHMGSRRLVLPCPVDLRRYLTPGQEYGICNLTSNYICDVTVGEESPFDDTLSQVADSMRRQKSSNACLKPMMGLNLMFKLLPFHVMEKVFHKVFTIPVVAFTNLGVVDRDRLRFGKTPIRDLFITGAVKYVPYFQIAVSTFDGVMTLSSNLHGTSEDRRKIEIFLAEVHRELLEGCKAQ